MSGVAGVVHFCGSPVEPGLVAKMTGAMAHRGPDGIRHWVRGPVALGQCMLRTTPESLEEVQPLTDEDESLVLVMDGRVDNREDLRRELMGRGAVLRDRSDAELVLRAYEAWGDRCATRVIGEFVFLVWDARRRELFAARDAAGARHFYYCAGDGWFAFASEIKGLLALERIAPRLQESRLLDYLVVEFDRDDEVGTFYEGISRLPAGHAMAVAVRGPRVSRYWDPSELAPLRFGSPGECEEAFLATLRVAVRCRLRSTGPVGAALSGGLDSSSIVGLVRKEMRDELVEPLRTFSLVREDRENCADWRGVEAMLRDGWMLPTVITSAAAGTNAADFLARLSGVDEPFALSGGFPDSLVWDAARDAGCRVLLDGMAGDLLFLHLRQSIVAAIGDREFARIPAVLRAYRRHGQRGGVRTAAWSALREATPERLRAFHRRLRRGRPRVPARIGAAGDLRHLIVPALSSRYLERRVADRVADLTCAGAGGHRVLHARNFTTGCLSFAYEVNNQEMLARGVEPRSPFSDRRLLEFAVRMPLSGKIAASWYKRLLRDCMAGILPDEVRWRESIGQHPGPQFYATLIDGLRTAPAGVWRRDRLGDTLGRWISAPALRALWREQERPGSRIAGYNILMLVILGEWLGARSPFPAFAD